MITGSALVPIVSRRLADFESGYEYEHWNEALLTDAYRYAVLAIAGSNKYKSKFTKRTTVTADATGVVQLPAECEGLVDRTFLDANGKRLPVVKDASKLAIFDKYACALADGTTPITGVAYDPENVNQIVLSPAGAGGAVQVNCFVPPTIESLETGVNLPTTAEPVLTELMLYYAMAMETESSPIRTQSEVHWTHAMVLLGGNAKVQKVA
jgi:hypothetical protein